MRAYRIEVVWSSAGCLIYYEYFAEYPVMIGRNEQATCRRNATISTGPKISLYQTPIKDQTTSWRTLGSLHKITMPCKTMFAAPMSHQIANRVNLWTLTLNKNISLTHKNCIHTDVARKYRKFSLSTMSLHGSVLWMRNTWLQDV